MTEQNQPPKKRMSDGMIVLLVLVCFIVVIAVGLSGSAENERDVKCDYKADTYGLDRDDLARNDPEC